MNKISLEFFSNSLNLLNKKQSEFNKSVFTICDYRENDKCPPWTIQAKKMLHDNKKKNDLLQQCNCKSV